MAVCLAISEIFSVKKWPDLEIWVRGHSRSLKLVLFETPGCDFLLAFCSNYGAIFYRLRGIATYWSKIAKFLYPTPPVFSAPAGSDPIGISRRCLIVIKLEWLGYRVLKKLWPHVKPFPQNTGTQRTTDGQTDGQCADTRQKSRQEKLENNDAVLYVYACIYGAQCSVVINCSYNVQTVKSCKR